METVENGHQPRDFSIFHSKSWWFLVISVTRRCEELCRWRFGNGSSPWSSAIPPRHWMSLKVWWKRLSFGLVKPTWTDLPRETEYLRSLGASFTWFWCLKIMGRVLNFIFSPHLNCFWSNRHTAFSAETSMSFQSQTHIFHQWNQPSQWDAEFHRGPTGFGPTAVPHWDAQLECFFGGNPQLDWSKDCGKNNTFLVALGGTMASWEFLHGKPKQLLHDQQNHVLGAEIGSITALKKLRLLQKREPWKRQGSCPQSPSSTSSFGWSKDFSRCLKGNFCGSNPSLKDPKEAGGRGWKLSGKNLSLNKFCSNWFWFDLYFYRSRGLQPVKISLKMLCPLHPFTFELQQKCTWAMMSHRRSCSFFVKVRYLVDTFPINPDESTLFKVNIYSKYFPTIHVIT